MDSGPSNRSLNFITLSFYSTAYSSLVYPLPGLMHPLAMCKSSLRALLRLSLSPRNILVAPRIRSPLVSFSW